MPDTSSRFLERIARTYRREHWDSMLRPLLTTWFCCAKQLGDVELSIRLLFEMMGHGLCSFIFFLLHLFTSQLSDVLEQEDTDQLQEDLLAVLQVFNT